MLRIEVLYIAKDNTMIQHQMMVQDGATVQEALEQSGILVSHPETQQLSVGIFSKPVGLDVVLKDGDRIELYRPLEVDPKENRRSRAREKK